MYSILAWLERFSRIFFHQSDLFVKSLNNLENSAKWPSLLNDFWRVWFVVQNANNLNVILRCWCKCNTVVSKTVTLSICFQVWVWFFFKGNRWLVEFLPYLAKNFLPSNHPQHTRFAQKLFFRRLVLLLNCLQLSRTNVTENRWWTWQLRGG